MPERRKGKREKRKEKGEKGGIATLALSLLPAEADFASVTKS